MKNNQPEQKVLIVSTGYVESDKNQVSDDIENETSNEIYKKNLKILFQDFYENLNTGLYIKSGDYKYLVMNSLTLFKMYNGTNTIYNNVDDFLKNNGYPFIISNQTILNDNNKGIDTTMFEYKNDLYSLKPAFLITDNDYGKYDVLLKQNIIKNKIMIRKRNQGNINQYPSKIVDTKKELWYDISPTGIMAYRNHLIPILYINSFYAGGVVLDLKK